MAPHPTSSLDQRAYFFDGGICFKCRQCGACCVGQPGTIYVSESDMARVIGHLGITRDVLLERYCYPFKDGHSIREDARGRCLFFSDGCSIYPARPLQCRTFPFWFSNLRSEGRWRRVEEACPGIGSGKRYGKDQILDIAGKTMSF